MAKKTRRPRKASLRPTLLMGLFFLGIFQSSLFLSLWPDTHIFTAYFLTGLIFAARSGMWQAWRHDENGLIKHFLVSLAGSVCVGLMEGFWDGAVFFLAMQAGMLSSMHLRIPYRFAWTTLANFFSAIVLFSFSLLFDVSPAIAFTVFLAQMIGGFGWSLFLVKEENVHSYRR